LRAQVHAGGRTTQDPRPDGCARAPLAIFATPWRLIADRAFDARKLRDWLHRNGAEAVIPPNPTRKSPRTYDSGRRGDPADAARVTELF
jgi:hypothetical protein